ncbi:SHOCT domain-containing protein [Jiangella muralis]|uniref:SHOCT domain-containing protein n=1 Tax=Jiangella muralis TaxID=702383 RepID=UPI00069FFFB9|nr:SHOCT domain-containing protein [Jiangella muralis]
MGLLRGMARTAVVAGTATAVSNRVSRRQAGRWQQQEYEQQAMAQPAPQPAPPAPAPAPAPEAPAEDSLADQLARLADLKAQGVLTDEEFAAAKARLLTG